MWQYSSRSWCWHPLQTQNQKIETHSANTKQTNLGICLHLWLTILYCHDSSFPRYKHFLWYTWILESWVCSNKTLCTPFIGQISLHGLITIIHFYHNEHKEIINNSHRYFLQKTTASSLIFIRLSFIGRVYSNHPITHLWLSRYVGRKRNS